MTPRRLRQRVADGETLDPNLRGIVRLGKVNTRILAGTEDLSLWSEEELIRGKRRDKNGGWQGKVPEVVPLAVHQELTKRKLREAEETLRDNLVEAVKALVEIVKGKDVEDKDRLKAIDMVMNRVMGKEPIKIEVGVENPIDEDIADITVIYDEDDVIDVDFTEVGSGEDD